MSSFGDCVGIETHWRRQREQRQQEKQRERWPVSLDIPGGPPRYIAIYSKMWDPSLCVNFWSPSVKRWWLKLWVYREGAQSTNRKKKELNLLSLFVSWWKWGSKRVNNLFKFSVIKSKLLEGNLNSGLILSLFSLSHKTSLGNEALALERWLNC